MFVLGYKRQAEYFNTRFYIPCFINKAGFVVRECYYASGIRLEISVCLYIFLHAGSPPYQKVGHCNETPFVSRNDVIQSDNLY